MNRFVGLYDDFQVNMSCVSGQYEAATKEVIIAFACEWGPVPSDLD